jgi:hypothetical protein
MRRTEGHRDKLNNILVRSVKVEQREEFEGLMNIRDNDEVGEDFLRGGVRCRDPEFCLSSVSVFYYSVICYVFY